MNDAGAASGAGWFDAGAWQRGVEVGARGALFDLRHQGAVFRARAHGTEGGRYHVSVTLSGGAVTAAHCTCVAGAEGRCKHAAALAQRALAAPEAFVAVPSWREGLRGRSRAELVHLIEQMLGRHPELETLLTLPMPGASRGRVDAAAIAREADTVFAEHGEAFGAEGPIVDQLAGLAALVGRFADAHDTLSALAVARGLIESVYRHLPEFEQHAQGEDLRALMLRVVHALASCLGRESLDAETRHAVTDCLVETRQRDLALGDVGPAEAIEELLRANLEPDERARLAAMLRARLPEALRDHREHLAWEEVDDGAFLFDLEAETLSEAAYLAGCRRLARHAEAVRHLVARGALREALGVAREAPSWALIEIAESLEAAGQGALAESLLTARSEQDRAPRLIDWLYARALARHDAEQVRLFAETRFGIRPDQQGFAMLKASTPGPEWVTVRERAFGTMTAHGFVHELVRALLDEDLVTRAAEQVLRQPTPFALREAVALAAERSAPEAALAVYDGLIESAVAERSRAGYQTAARLAARVVALYAARGEVEAGATFVAALRGRHARLRALHDELRRAGV
ncbi:MAG: hypothetical protein JNK72_16385 [Myxococcales bacterium]|nr:hypothetical protein [Myxococcales bacterium]